jgi:hypothetical protein
MTKARKMNTQSTMKLMMLLCLAMFAIPAAVHAQTLEEHKKAIYESDYEKETTHLDKFAFDQVLRAVSTGIDQSQAKSLIEWSEKGAEFRAKDCFERRSRCVEVALKGGHQNDVAEKGRLYFCKTSRKMCGEDWK